MQRPLLAAIVALAALCPPALAADKPIGTFMWAVEPPGGLAKGAKPDHLYGTMHVPLKAGRAIPAGVGAIVKRAQRFVMEVDDADVDGAKVAKYAAGTTNLKAALGPVRWKKLVALAKPHGLDEEAMPALDAWFVALAFLPQPPPGEVVIDDRLKSMATGARVPVKYLETADEQLAALDAISDQEDLAQLIEIIDDPKKPDEEMAQLEAAYLAGDLPAVERYLFDPEKMKLYPDFYEKLFDARNRKWLPQLEATMRREEAFVAVGLGHLLGERGVVKLLQKRGWKVTRAKV